MKFIFFKCILQSIKTKKNWITIFILCYIYLHVKKIFNRFQPFQRRVIITIHLRDKKKDIPTFNTVLLLLCGCGLLINILLRVYSHISFKILFYHVLVTSAISLVICFCIIILSSFIIDYSTIPNLPNLRPYKITIYSKPNIKKIILSSVIKSV